MYETIGTRVRATRDALGMSQEELARKSGVSRITISKIECGHAENISTWTAVALSRALSVDVGFLLCGK